MITTLRHALPAAEFTEHHELTVDAPPEAVWHALQTCRWSDLRWSKPLFLARGLGLRRSTEPARRRFARYWRLIRPFSGLVRHDLLRAVARRAGTRSR